MRNARTKARLVSYRFASLIHRREFHFELRAGESDDSLQNLLAHRENPFFTDSDKTTREIRGDPSSMSVDGGEEGTRERKREHCGHAARLRYRTGKRGAIIIVLSR